MHVRTTCHPTSEWTGRQIVEACGWERAPPRFLIHDRDSRYGMAFDLRLKALGIRSIRTPFRSPQANAIAERWVKSVRTECLDHYLILNGRHLRRVLTEYVTYFNRWRPHRSLGQRAPRALRDRRPATPAMPSRVKPAIPPTIPPMPAPCSTPSMITVSGECTSRAIRFWSACCPPSWTASTVACIPMRPSTRAIRSPPKRFTAWEIIRTPRGCSSPRHDTPAEPVRTTPPDTSPPPSSQSNPDRRLYAVPFWSAAAGSTGRFSGGLLLCRSQG